MNSWPMIERSWLAQWRGFSPEEQAWMWIQSAKGHPTFISLGHSQHPLWSIERFDLNIGSTADDLISVKIDFWPMEFES